MWHLKQLGLESGKVATRGWAGGAGIGRVLIKGHKLTVRRCVRSGDLTHRPAAIVNHTVLHTSTLLRDQVLSVPTTDEMIKLCDVMGTNLCYGGNHIANATVVTILHYITVSKQHIAHLELKLCYLSVISHV